MRNAELTGAWDGTRSGLSGPAFSPFSWGPPEPPHNSQLTHDLQLKTYNLQLTTRDSRLRRLAPPLYISAAISSRVRPFCSTQLTASAMNFAAEEVITSVSRGVTIIPAYSSGGSAQSS